MRYSGKFGQVEAALAAMHGIASEKRTAFQARLKNFQRLGLIDDVKAGRGKAAVFEAHHMLLLALALEMAQMGVGPERSVQIIKDNLARIAAAVIASIPTAREGFGDDWSPTVIYFDPRGLASLEDADEGVVEVAFNNVDAFLAEFPDRMRDHRRLAAISITALIVRLADAVVPTTFKGRMTLDFDPFFARALVDWAKGHG